MDECLEDSRSILQRERETLEWIRNKAWEIDNLRTLRSTAEDSYQRFDARYGMSVGLCWESLYPSNDCTVLHIHLGGLIQLKEDAIDNLSYSLCICRPPSQGEAGRVLRKYHFDYANKTIRGERRSSAFHLQTSGKPDPFVPSQYEYGHLDVWLEEPRIFYFPMSLALMLHMAFREFPDEFTDRLCNDGAWLSRFVRRDQDKLLLPFLEGCIKNARTGVLWDIACSATGI